MGKYRKFREEIRHMADECFPKAEESQELKDLSSTTPGAYVRQAIDAHSSKKKSPYALYAKRLRNRTLIVLGVFLLVLIGFVGWFLLLQGRKA